MVEELAQKLDTVQLIFTSQIDTLWVLICTCLVFLMQGGFMCLEAGITRPKNSINIALKNITDMSVAITVFWMFGFGLMFGSSFYGIFGTEYFFSPQIMVLIKFIFYTKQYLLQQQPVSFQVQ